MLPATLACKGGTTAFEGRFAHLFVKRLRLGYLIVKGARSRVVIMSQCMDKCIEMGGDGGAEDHRRDLAGRVRLQPYRASADVKDLLAVKKE